MSSGLGTAGQQGGHCCQGSQEVEWGGEDQVADRVTFGLLESPCLYVIERGGPGEFLAGGITWE